MSDTQAQPDHNDAFIINAIRKDEELSYYGIAETTQHVITADIDKVNALTGEIILSPRYGTTPRASVRSTWVVDGVPYFLLSVLTLRQRDFSAAANPTQAGDAALPVSQASQEESASHAIVEPLPQTTFPEPPSQPEHTPQASCESANDPTI